MPNTKPIVSLRTERLMCEALGQCSAKSIESKKNLKRKPLQEIQTNLNRPAYASLPWDDLEEVLQRGFRHWEAGACKRPVESLIEGYDGEKHHQKRPKGSPPKPLSTDLPASFTTPPITSPAIFQNSTITSPDAAVNPVSPNLQSNPISEEVLRSSTQITTPAIFQNSTITSPDAAVNPVSPNLQSNPISEEVLRSCTQITSPAIFQNCTITSPDAAMNVDNNLIVIPVSPNFQSNPIPEEVGLFKSSTPITSPDASVNVINSLQPGECITMIIPVSPNLENFTVLSDSFSCPEIEPPVIRKQLFDDMPNLDAMKQKKKKRCDRRNCCFFCDCVITNLTRHMIRQHSREIEVAEYIALLETCPTESKSKRMEIMENLRTKGNFSHNSNILKNTPVNQDSSILLPVKRPSLSKKKTLSDYITCSICQSLFLKRSYFKHAAICLAKEKENSVNTNTSEHTVTNEQCTNYVKQYGLQLYPKCESTSKAMRDIIIPMLRKDDYGLSAINDSLIVATCSDYMQSHPDPKDRTIVTRKMRDSAKLLFSVKSRLQNVSELKDIYHTSNANIVIEAVQELCVCSEDGEVGTVGMPARLSWVIFESGKRLIDDILTSNVLSEESKKIQKSEVKNFLEIVRRRWKYYISTNAERSRTQKKMLKEKIIPPSEDVRKFGIVLREKGLEYLNSLKENITAETYVKLCKVSIAQIMTLNARRPLEAAKIKLLFFQCRPKGQTINTELLSELTEEERKSYDYLSEFYVPGKNGQDCSVLLTKEMEQSLELIVKCRSVLNIPSSNKFLFARPGLTSAFDGSAIMRELRQLADLAKPNFMTANGIRHHHATMGTLRGREFTSNLSNHMSHTLDVHNKNYCYPLDIVNRGKVGHFLLGLQGLTSASESEVQTIQDVALENISFNAPAQEALATNFNINDEDEEWLPPNGEIDEEEQAISIDKKKRKRWSDLEKKIVVEKFQDLIRSKRNPGHTKCKQLIAVEPALASRTANQVYVFIDNVIKGKLNLSAECNGILRMNTKL